MMDTQSSFFFRELPQSDLSISGDRRMSINIMYSSSSLRNVRWKIDLLFMASLDSVDVDALANRKHVFGVGGVGNENLVAEGDKGRPEIG
jgi:hypothetical protein